MNERTCRVCGCTDDNCAGCIERTGTPCYWVAKDLCSACAGRTDAAAAEIRPYTEVLLYGARDEGAIGA